VQHRLSLSSPDYKVGFGTMTAAITALSLVVIGYVFF